MYSDSSKPGSDPGKNFILLKWNNFDNFLPKSLAVLYGSGEFTDVTLVVETKSF
jgi:hypothetical protein